LGLWQAWRSTGPVGRPPCWHIAVGLGSTDRSTGLMKETQFCKGGRPVGRPTKNREQMFLVGRPVGRPTNLHKRARPGHRTRSTGPVGRFSLKQNNLRGNSGFGKFWKIFLIGYVTKCHAEKINIHDLNMI